MFKIKLKKIVQAQHALNNLLTKELPVKTSFRLSRLISKLNSELKQYESTRDDLIKKLGKKEGKDSWRIPDDDKVNIEKFQKEIDVLMDVEVEISGYTPVSLGELESIRISPVDLSQIEDFIDTNN